MRDTIKDGIYAGLIGSLGDAAIHAPAYAIIGTTMTAHYISQLIFPFKEVTTVRWLIGFVPHFFAGAIVGVVLTFIFKYFGEDYAYYKGIGLGVALWILHVAIIPNIVSPRPFIFRTETEAVVDLLAHITFGILATLYLTRLSGAKEPL